jgi:hypothetical protein
MSVRSWQLSGLVCIAAGVALAQQGSVAGPVSGMVFDRGARGLRPVLGIPGASLLGSPVALGVDVSAAWVAPLQNATFVAGADGKLHWFRFDAGKTTEAPLDDRAIAPQAVIFSPSGTAAVMVSGNHAQIMKGLPDAPALAGELDLPVEHAARPVVRHLTLAINDDASYLLFGSNGTIRLLGMSGENRKLLDTAGPAFVAFAAGGSDGAVVDARGSGVILFRELARAGNPETVAAVDERIASTSGVAFSADGRRVFLSTASGRGVDVLDLASKARSTVECACSPAGMTRMGNLYRLNDPGTEPLWMFDPGAAEPRIVFVPPAGTP